MYHRDDFLERIRQTEINKLNKLSLKKLFSNMHIETTKEFEGIKSVKEGLLEKKFKHDSMSKYLLLIFAVFISSSAIKDTFFNSNSNTALLVLEYFLSILFIFAAIRQFFFDKPLNYYILIDKTKIEIEKQTFLWKDIYETAILTKGGGKVKREYFIIAMKDLNTYEIFELNNFTSYWNFSATLSKYIEHFKPTVGQ
jgi:hypothetical protein